MAPPIIGLLQAASEGRRDWRLSAFDEAQVCWAVERVRSSTPLHRDM